MEADHKGDLFPKKRVERIQEAISRNKGEKDDIYYHPAYSRMVLKCIDLSCHRPLHAAGSRHFKEPESKKSEEKWLEAYLIQQAKKNGWILELCGKKYKFLYSQLNFKSEGEADPRPLDLLLYDPQCRSLVVLELKVTRQLKRAKEELQYYTKKIRESKGRIADVFHLPSDLSVLGYIVWPSNARGRQLKLDDWGLIEYPWMAAPWAKFKETDRKPIIHFDLVKQAGGPICEHLPKSTN